MPYFSIIIPTYNRAEIISKSIDSVISQKFEDWELIIVDDGSTDNTKFRIDDFKNDKIKYIRQENAERGAARNNGVRNAKGNYVFFLDSDDILYPEHLQHGYEQLIALKEPEFFHVRYEEIFAEEKKWVPLLHEKTIRKKVFRQNQFACQFFLRKDIAINFPFSENRDLKIGEDWEIVLKIAVRYPLHFSNRVLAGIVQHGERTMEIASAETILKSRDILCENLRLDELIPPELIRNVNAELTSLGALAYSISGEKRKAFKTWNMALKTRFGICFNRRTLAIFKKIIFGGKS